MVVRLRAYLSVSVIPFLSRRAETKHFLLIYSVRRIVCDRVEAKIIASIFGWMAYLFIFFGVAVDAM